MKKQVLLSIMSENPLEIIKRAKITTDCICINQTSFNKKVEYNIDHQNITILNTTDRGLSRSRNLAIQMSDADICILADDDVIFYEDYEKKIDEAYNKHKDADMIVFNFDSINSARGFKSKKFKKDKESSYIKLYCSMNITFKRESIVKNKIKFNEMFGSGAYFNSGEDSLFCKTAFKVCKVYENPESIMMVDYSYGSMWFNGYDEKFFSDKGAWCFAAFKRWDFIYKWYLIFRLKSKTELTIFNIYMNMEKGKHEYIEVMNRCGCD